MSLKVLIGVAVAVALVQLAEAACDKASVINGCSIPYNMPFPFKSVFKEACNRHDVCYGCGSGRGITRGKCDLAFLKDMLIICAKRFWEILTCTQYANVYAGAVALAGKKHYETSPLSYCPQSWVSACLP